MDKDELKTLRYYSGIALGYSNLYGEEQIQKITQVKEFFPKQGTLLDVGSANGVLNRFLTKNIFLVSLDLCFELLKLNKNKNKLQASVLNLPFKNESMDNVCAFTVFQDVSNPENAIKEVKRVLKKDGVFILSFLHMSSKAEKILKSIKVEFEIIKRVKEEKDCIFILKKC